jgi:cation diffusion facilitator family transporter
MTPPSPKIAAARVSLATASSLAVLKLFTGLATGSLAVLTSAVDSLLDILMSGVNFMAIRQAEQPADDRHPYGHGKFETLATIFQALVIAGSGGWICLEAVRRLQSDHVVSKPLGGIAVMLVSLTASWLITRYLRKVARQTDSSALAADALHFATDVYSNLALLAGLVVLFFFDLPWIDPVMSLLVAGYIIVQAFGLLRHAMCDLLDEQLPETVRAEIEQLIDHHKGELFGYHNLRTRRAGSQKLIDFHLTVCKHLSVDEAHGITDHLEEQITAHVGGADITIHIEPCQQANCPGRNDCPALQERKRDGKLAVPS